MTVSPSEDLSILWTAKRSPPKSPFWKGSPHAPQEIKQRDDKRLRLRGPGEVFLLTWEEALAVILRANSPNEFQPLDLAGQITGWQSAGEDMKTTAPLTDTGLKALSTLLPEKPTV